MKIEPWMIISAFRYSLGRRTYVVSECVDWLTENWQWVNESTKKIILREIKEAIDSNLCGDPCDCSDWREILTLSEKQHD